MRKEKKKADATKDLRSEQRQIKDARRRLQPKADMTSEKMLDVEARRRRHKRKTRKNRRLASVAGLRFFSLTFLERRRFSNKVENTI